jgi:hypothetical protein
MRLKKHRDDVRWLKSYPEEKVEASIIFDIAKKYLNLIRMAEETFQYRGSAMPTRVEKRVLKDGLDE